MDSRDLASFGHHSGTVIKDLNHEEELVPGRMTRNQIYKWEQGVKSKFMCRIMSG
ncbi:rCG51424, partial [Rattus norvegicus]